MSDRDTYEFPVVGTYYIPGAIELAASLSVGTPLRIVPEPENPKDKYALMVFVGEEHIGYVPNRGSSCSKCWSPAAPGDNWCKTCGAPFEDLVRGGLARRWAETNTLKTEHVCYVSKTFPESESSPVYATLITR